MLTRGFDTTSPDYRYLGALNQRLFASQMEEAFAAGTPLPRIVQSGPTCGLALAVAVMAAHKKRHPGNASLHTPVVHSADSGRDYVRDPSVPLDGSEDLLQYARRKGYTKDGAIFDIGHMADLYRHYGYDTEIVHRFTEADLNAALDLGYTPVFAFDVASDGNPSLNGGRKVHWAALEGHFSAAAANLVIATHTWEGADYLWRASDVIDSSRGLSQADKELFPEAPDLRAGLAGQLLIVKGPLKP